MSPLRAITTCFARYVQFSGRAPLSEYWWFTLFILVGALITGAMDRAWFGTGDMMTISYRTGILQPAFQLAVLLPSLAVTWRRMHDTGRPGWFILVPAVVLAALAAVMVFGMMGFLNMQNSYSMMRGNGGLVAVGLSLLSLLAVTIALGVCVFWLTRPSQPTTNKYGPPPGL